MSDTAKALRESSTSSENKPSWRWCLIIYGAGLLTRVFFILFSPFVSGDQREFTSIAHNLLEYGKFSITPASPTIFRPPAYAFFIALVYAVFGERNEAVWIVQAILGGLIGVILYLTLRRFFSEGNSRFTALMTAIYPNLSFWAATILSETLLALCLMLMVYCVYRAIDERSIRFAIIAGVLSALSILIVPRFMAAPLIVSVSIWLGQRKRPKSLKPVLLSFCAALLMLTPWTIRNYVVFGLINPASMQGPGIHLWLAAKRVAVYDFQWVNLRRTEPLMQRYDELHKDEAGELRHIKERAQVQKDMLLDGMRIIKDDPIGYLKDRGRKYHRLWIQPAAYAGNFRPPFTSQNRNLSVMIAERSFIPATARILSIITFTLLPLLLVICGIFILLPRWKEHAVVYMLFLWVALFQAPLFITFNYTVVIHPTMAVFSAAALERIIAWWKNHKTQILKKLKR